MKIKLGASIRGLDIRMRPVLIHAERIWRAYGQELIITSGLDGTHSAGSFHYYGLAVDLRTRYFSESDKQLVLMELRDALSNDYDLVLHRTHLHVEYDKDN